MNADAETSDMAVPDRIERPRQRARTRGRIERAARDLFRNGGYLTCTVADIVKAAGLSRAVFYHHFRDKRDVLEAIVRDQMAVSGRKFTRVSLPPNPSDADLANWIRRFVDSIYRSMDGVRLMSLGIYINGSVGAISYEVQSAGLLELGKRVPAFGLYDDQGNVRDVRLCELNLIIYEIGQVAIALGYGAWPGDIAVPIAISVGRLRQFIDRAA